MSDSTDKLDTGGTARMDAGTARMDGSQGTSPAGGGTIFADGQTLILNGKNCVIEKIISMGSGEAVVYKINIDDKPYTLKHYKPNTPLSDTAKKLLTKIRDNPRERIVKIFDFGSYDGQDFEIMEYAEGGTLGEYVKKKGAIRDAKLKDVVKQINEGLQQLHRNYKAIYQDLKPENIFFRDAKKSSLVLADFGISSIMQDGSEEVEVTASVTDLYGAPELARKGNNTTVEVTPAVDYFALGITLYELWLGEQPFKEIKATTRERHIQNGDVDFPIDMPDDCKTLIKGLLTYTPKDRMGNEHIQKWLKGETLASDNKKPDAVTGTVYKPLKFGNESASNPKEMAALMEKYPDAGKVSLYDGFITDTLKEAKDATLYTEIKNVISQYDKDREAGLTAAIYTLDPERPFKSRKGKICETGEEIADAIMDDSAHYMEDLKNLNAALYIYLTVTEGSQGKEVADTFRKYCNEYPGRAINHVYLKLQGDGGITIGSKRYLSADELAQEKDEAQTDLVKKAVKEKNSQLLVWISDEYEDYFKSTEGFAKLSTPEQFFLLGLLPFLSFKELTGNNGDAALKDLIDNYPERADLFEAYAAQGLPLKGSILDSPAKKTPIDYVVRNINGLYTKHGIATINNLIRLLCKLGADVNECSDNLYPLTNAFNARNDALVNLLLEIGADRGKYDELVAQRAENERIKAENERIERERRAEEQRREQERIAEAKRNEREYNEEEERKGRAKKRNKILLSIALPVVATMLFAIGLILAFGDIGATLTPEALFEELISDPAGLIFLGVILGLFAILHFVPTDINFFTGLLRVISIIGIGGSCIGCIVVGKEAVDIGWIALLVMIFAFVMALVKPIWDLKDENVQFDTYGWRNMDSVTMNRYLKIKTFKAMFRKIVLIAAASMVLLLAGFIVYNSQKNSLSIPAGVTDIGDREYRRKQLVDVKIPDGVTTIGKEAFMKNKLSGIEIPAGVTDIGDNAFVGNNLTTITIGANVTLGSNVFDAGFDEFYKNNGSSAGTYKRPGKRSFDWSAWHNSFKFRNGGIIRTMSIIGYDGNRHGIYGDLIIPEEISGYPVKIIGNRAFFHLRFTGVTIPNSVTIIEEEAFRGGSGQREYFENSSFVPPLGTIHDLTIGTGVTTIGNSAFEYNKLSAIVIPNNVTSIGVSAFANNPVTSVRLGANVKLGDAPDNLGILGRGTGFNTAYANNGMRAGTYTRPNTDSTTWTRR